MNRTLLLVMPDVPGDAFFYQIEQRSQAKVLRFDLAWHLFLPKNGKDEQGRLDLPEGNPRSQWFSLIHWLTHSLRELANISENDSNHILAFLPPCTEATLDFVSRQLSYYVKDLGIIRADLEGISRGILIEQVTDYFKGLSVNRIEDGWLPPILTLNSESLPPSLAKSSKQKGEGSFTWLSGLIGSDRLFAQFYQLAPGATGNRLHCHSGVEELYYVLDGEGTLITLQGEYPLSCGDLVVKPSGSGLATQFRAGEKGLFVLDIEVVADYDQTDIVYYPHHRELLLRGGGVFYGTSNENLFPGREIMNKYTDKYVRGMDGKIEERP